MSSLAKTIPPAGTDGGPCLECSHTDCAWLRRLAGSECRLCGQPLGYGAAYLPASRTRGVHASCTAVDLGVRISANVQALALARGLPLGEIAATAFPEIEIDDSRRARGRRACQPAAQLRDLDRVAAVLGVDVSALLEPP